MSKVVRVDSKALTYRSTTSLAFIASSSAIILLLVKVLLCCTLIALGLSLRLLLHYTKLYTNSSIGNGWFHLFSLELALLSRVDEDNLGSD